MVLSIFTESCNHYKNLIIKHFCGLKEAWQPSPWQPLIYFLSLISLFRTFPDMHGIIQYVFRVHPCYSSCQYLVSFYGWIILCCVDMPHSVCPVDGYLGCFYFLAIITNAAKNIYFGVDMFSFLLYVYLVVELLGHILTHYMLNDIHTYI